MQYINCTPHNISTYIDNHTVIIYCTCCNKPYLNYSDLYWYKNKCYCKDCYNFSSEFITVKDILYLYNYQLIKIEQNSFMKEGIATEKQLRFIRFIHMYSSSKSLPDTSSYESIQDFINKYKEQALYLFNKLKRLCSLSEQGFPILASLYVPCKFIDPIYINKIFINWINKDEKDFIKFDYNYDESEDRKLLTNK